MRLPPIFDAYYNSFVVVVVVIRCVNDNIVVVGAVTASLCRERSLYTSRVHDLQHLTTSLPLSSLYLTSTTNN